ncbi:MAG TPA: hypothetical protein VLD57_05030, partial [Blastocatellia bacterium]|nr:hypothetical protein [Blastocatellia bacterium]
HLSGDSSVLTSRGCVPGCWISVGTTSEADTMTKRERKRAEVRTSLFMITSFLGEERNPGSSESTEFVSLRYIFFFMEVGSKWAAALRKQVPH